MSSSSKNVLDFNLFRHQRVLKSELVAEYVNSVTPDDVRNLGCIVLGQLLCRAVSVHQYESHLEYNADDIILEIGVNADYFYAKIWDDNNRATELKVSISGPLPVIANPAEYRATLAVKSLHIRDSVRVSVINGRVTCSTCLEFWGGASVQKIQFVLQSLVSSLRHVSAPM